MVDKVEEISKGTQTVQKFGTLLNSDIKLNRNYFSEMCSLIGIQVIYRAPKPDKHYTNYGEIESNYYAPMLTGCIFSEHPNQQTLKKLGWVSELQEEASIIEVPYDLPQLQQGSLFIIPSAIDEAVGRVFRVVKLSTSMIYPSSVTCEIVPEYESTFSNSTYNHEHNDFNLLNDEEPEDK